MQFLRSLGHCDTISDLVKHATGLSSWRAFRCETQLKRLIEQLKLAQVELDAYRARMIGTQPYEIINLLAMMRRTLCAPGGVTEEIIKLFAYELDDEHPVSAEEMLELIQQIKDMSRKEPSDDKEAAKEYIYHEVEWIGCLHT